MKKNFLAILSLALMATVLTGCIRTVDGHVKAGVPFKKDKIYSRYEAPMSTVFEAAKEALAFKGVLTREDTINNTLEAKVDQRTVRVKIIEEEPRLTQVITQVRTKGGGADIDVAAEVDKLIALRLPAERRR